MSQPVFAVLTVSDSCHRDPTRDRSGPRLVKCLTESFPKAQIIADILPDNRETITAKLRHLLDQKPSVGLIITTGGTGFAPRDVTPEATKPVLEKECCQLSMAIAHASFKKTKFAALSRGVCGISGRTLILNFPGSEKAVAECFEVIQDILPHALELIGNDLLEVRRVHDDLQSESTAVEPPFQGARHVCPHKTGPGNGDDRNSTFAMIPLAEAVQLVYDHVSRDTENSRMLSELKAAVDIPPFRASIKDGYAMKASGFSGTKKVVGYVSAGDQIVTEELQEDECYKINTGAPVPLHANCVVQIEDTKLLKVKKNGNEDLVEILIDPSENMDIRAIGSDLRKGSKMFPVCDHSPVVVNSILASIGKRVPLVKPKIAIVSTGSELMEPLTQEAIGKIYDSNTTMLEQLLTYFGFECATKMIIADDASSVKKQISCLFQTVDFVICTGGVSMGDKDFVKPVLQSLGFNIVFGRVNMKPGKPMTFATQNGKYFFGLPGNPVSAFVTFHLLALPAIRWASGWQREKCKLPELMVTLQNEKILLDQRPEFVRASLILRDGRLWASVNGNQISSRLQSIVGADALIHLPARTEERIHVLRNDLLRASVLRYDFISKYE